MLSSQLSERSIDSPIGKVPYDVLLEIFIHCLPQDRLDPRQPNTQIGPILLCHICSSWRTVALASPTLWSHLAYRLSPWRVHADPGDAEFVFSEHEIDFLRWWKKNQGSMAPFLRVDMRSNPGEMEIPLARDGLSFVVHYVGTAQYLELDRMFWFLAKAMVKYGSDSDYVAFPNLHTFVTSPIKNHCYHMLSVLRRLALPNYYFPLSDDNIPAQWSALTHLSVASYDMSYNFWVSLTSTVRCLQWVYVSFNTLLAKHKHPIQRTLPRLSTLFINSGRGNDVDCLINPLFAALHLPALNYLFLSSNVRDWWDHRDVLDIHTSLQSTPALKILTLRTYKRLSPTDINNSVQTLATVGDVAPVWSSVPHLVHLNLELFIAWDQTEREAAKELDSFAHSAFFSDNRWLDLDNPACPVKTITVINLGWVYLDDQPESDGTRRETPSIRKSAGKASNVALHLRSEPVIDFRMAWKEWRSVN